MDDAWWLLATPEGALRLRLTAYQQTCLCARGTAALMPRAMLGPCRPRALPVLKEAFNCLDPRTFAINAH